MIAESTVALDAWMQGTRDDVLAASKLLVRIDEATTELRRRGDTLVRRDDLRVALAGDQHIGLSGEREATRAATARLENAIGGKLMGG